MRVADPLVHHNRMNSVMQEFTMYNGETYSGVQAEGYGFYYFGFK